MRLDENKILLWQRFAYCIGDGSRALQINSRWRHRRKNSRCRRAEAKNTGGVGICGKCDLIARRNGNARAVYCAIGALLVNIDLMSSHGSLG